MNEEERQAFARRITQDATPCGYRNPYSGEVCCVPYASHHSPGTHQLHGFVIPDANTFVQCPKVRNP